MAKERVVLGRLGKTSMVRVHWTEHVPGSVSDPDLLEDFGAVWEGEELVTYDLDELVSRMERNDADEFMIDND